MREEVRQAAEREAIDIVTAARRDVRRIIVEARRELLVLTAQLHAAVETTDTPALQAPHHTALLADPQARDITDGLHEARRGVRSVLDEARAEIEALSSEAPDIFTPPHRSAAHDRDGRDTPNDEFRAFDQANEGPVHELSLDASLAALDFQTRDLPIPTLARILGSETAAEPTDPPRLSELRSLLRESVNPREAPASVSAHPAPPPDAAPGTASPFTSGPAPTTDFFADLEARVNVGVPETGAEGDRPLDTDRFTPPSRLFAEDDTQAPARSARTFIVLFAATGALAVIGTLWWALSRDSALSAAAPPVISEKSAAAPPSPAPAAAATPAVATTAPGTLALTIEARRPSWIRAQIDGKEETGRIYQAGETRHIYGARTVSIRAGDAGAVFVGMDGGASRALGADGMPATKQFSAAVAPVGATANSAAPVMTSASSTAPASAAPRTPVAETTAAPAPRSQVAPPSAAPAPVRDGVGGGRPDLVQAAQQWLDAYQRRDRDVTNAMSVDNITVSDERSVAERFPAWQAGVQRDIDEVALELTGDVAVFTARMTERADGGAQHVSRVSQFWQRRNGRWYVTNVRLIGEARLNQIIR